MPKLETIILSKLQIPCYTPLKVHSFSLLIPSYNIHTLTHKYMFIYIYILYIFIYIYFHLYTYLSIRVVLLMQKDATVLSFKPPEPEKSTAPPRVAGGSRWVAGLLYGTGKWLESLICRIFTKRDEWPRVDPPASFIANIFYDVFLVIFNQRLFLGQMVLQVVNVFFRFFGW